MTTITNITESNLPSPSTNFQHYNDLRSCAAKAVKELGEAPIAIVLGSGLNGFTKRLVDTKSISYSDLPFMPTTSVAGHAGRLFIGTIPPTNPTPDAKPARVYCFAGRVHGYEGFHLYSLTWIARLAAFMGCKVLIVTNAAGGASHSMKPGTIVVINDHVNCTNRSAVEGTYEDARLCPAIPPSESLYSPRLSRLAHSVANDLGFGLFDGVYCMNPGPSYETPAEVEMAIKMGASAVGMSTVPEVIAARSLGLEIFGMSLVTNMAAGLSDEVLTHEGVSHEANLAGPRLESLVMGLVSRIYTEIFPLNDIHPTLNEMALNPVTVNSLYRSPQDLVAPTLSEALEAAYLVSVANFGFSQPSAAYLLGYGHDYLLSSLSDRRELSLSELPFMPRASRSARNGRITVGTATDGKRVLAVSGMALEGLDPVEARFLVSMLLLLGLRELVQTVNATGTGLCGGCNGLAKVMTDYTNHTRQAPAPLDSELLAAVGMKRLRPALADRLRVVLPSKEPLLMGMPGPVPSTPAELTLAKNSGCAVVTPNSLAMMDNALLAGMDGAIVGVISAINEESIQSTRPADLVNIFDPSVLNGSVMAAPYSGSVDCSAKRPLLSAQSCCMPAAGSTTQLPMQGSLDAAKEAAKLIAGENGNALPLALFVDECMEEDIMKVMAVDREIPAAAIDSVYYGSWSLASSPAFRPKLLVGHVKEQPAVRVVVMIGMRPYTEAESPCTLVHATRVFHELGVKSFLVLMSAASCTPNGAANVGDLLILRDHINFTGQSPLTGRNVDEWGVRFPDMGKAYDEAVRRFVLKTAEAHSIPIRESVVGYINDPRGYTGRADGVMAFNGGAEAVARSGVPEAVTIRHMRHQLCGLCLVNQHTQVADSTPESVPVSHERLVQLLRDLIPFMHSEALATQTN